MITADVDLHAKWTYGGSESIMLGATTVVSLYCLKRKPGQPVVASAELIPVLDKDGLPVSPHPDQTLSCHC